MWTVKIELLRPIILIMTLLLSVSVFFCPIHTTVTFVDVLTVVNDLFQARNSYSLSFLPVETRRIGGNKRLHRNVPYLKMNSAAIAFASCASCPNPTFRIVIRSLSPAISRVYHFWKIEHHFSRRSVVESHSWDKNSVKVSILHVCGVGNFDFPNGGNVPVWSCCKDWRQIKVCYLRRTVANVSPSYLCPIAPSSARTQKRFQNISS